jgi:hypothetical protein
MHTLTIRRSKLEFRYRCPFAAPKIDKLTLVDQLVDSCFLRSHALCLIKFQNKSRTKVRSLSMQLALIDILQRILGRYLTCIQRADKNQSLWPIHAEKIITSSFSGMCGFWVPSKRALCQ